MNKNKLYVVFSLLVLIASILVNFWSFRQKRILRDFQHEVTKLEFENNLLTDLALRHVKYSEIELMPEFELSDLDNNHYKWSDLQISNKLFFRFSESHCIECVKSQVQFLNRLKNDIGDDKIVLLTSYDTRRALITTLKALNLEFETYNISDIELASYNPNIESLNTPYLFYIDSMGETKGIFFPMKETPSVSELYYKWVSEVAD